MKNFVLPLLLLVSIELYSEDTAKVYFKDGTLKELPYDSLLVYSTKAPPIIYHTTDLSTITITNFNSVNDINSDINKVAAFPNPSNNRFNIQIKNSIYGVYKFKIVDELGRIVYSDEYSNLSTSEFNYILDCRTENKNLKSGIYLLEITEPNNNKCTIKIILKDN